MLTGVERFLSMCEPVPWSGCLVWTGNHVRGYGRVWNGQSMVSLHRWSLESASGERLAPGAVVMHSCDNRSCVNPDHLSVGTHRANVHDAIKKGRHAIAFGPDGRCKRNHNTLVTGVKMVRTPNGKEARACAECIRENNRAAKKRARARRAC